MATIAIVGAGIFGVTVALELRRRGHTVLLFDPGPLPHPDAASTDISKVVRMDYGPEDFYLELMEAAFPGWDEWNARWPRPLYHQTGILFLTHAEMRPGDFEYESQVRLEKYGFPIRRLDPQALRESYPAWNPAVVVDGYFNPRAGWAESAEVVSRLVHEARAEGVQLYEGTAFGGLIEDHGRVRGILTGTGERHTADFVVVAAGSWTPVLLPQLSQVMWAVGQPVLHFRPENFAAYQPPRFPVWAAGLHDSGWYGFPARQDGILKIAHHGPGRQIDPREPRRVAASEESRFREFFARHLPGLEHAPLAGTRLCLYCDTFDGNFWIDHDPNHPGLIVAAGDSGHAFKFAPLLGKITADVIEGKANRFAARFAWRAPETGKAEPGRPGSGSPTPRK
jgi:glycine/D-amino acid oxidase-like deaminating enzyme